MLFKWFDNKRLIIKIFLFMKFLNNLSLGNFTNSKINDCDITDARLDSCDFI